VNVDDRSWASAQLIEAAQAGDRESITAVLYGAHSHVRRFAEHLCASPQDAEDAAQAIQELPDVQRRVLIMRDVLGYPGRTAAEALGLSNAAMKSQLHRARNRLRISLGDTAGPAEGPHPPGTTSA
jgi:DNA-directed RNA polymerase specialized sigma24 family protein